MESKHSENVNDGTVKGVKKDDIKGGSKQDSRPEHLESFFLDF